MAPILVGVLGIGTVIGMVGTTRNDLLAVSARVALMIVFSPAVLSIVILPVGLLAVLLNLGFGWDLAAAAPFVSISAETAPAGWWKVVIVPTEPLRARMGFHHSRIHDNPNTAFLIGDWIVSGRRLWFTPWSDWG